MGAEVTRRILPPDEWHRLTGTELETVWQILPVDRSCVLVVEDGDQIVGCWAFLTVLHAEGVYVAPAYRNRSSVARHLIRGMREIAKANGAETVWTGSTTEQVATFCKSLGGSEPPFTSWVIPMVRGES